MSQHKDCDSTAQIETGLRADHLTLAYDAYLKAGREGLKRHLTGSRQEEEPMIDPAEQQPKQRHAKGLPKIFGEHG